MRIEKYTTKKRKRFINTLTIITMRSLFISFFFALLCFQVKKDITRRIQIKACTPQLYKTKQPKEEYNAKKEKKMTAEDRKEGD